MTRNTMASCIQTWVMLWGSRRLHQTNPFLFAISLTEHKIKPKKSRGNTNSIPRVEGFWLWGGWWKDLPQTCRATTFLKQNPFLHSQTVIALLRSPCGSVSPKQLVVQSQCHLAGKRYGCLYCFIYQPHDCPPISISTSLFNLDPRPLWNSVSKQNNKKTKEPVW